MASDKLTLSPKQLGEIAKPDFCPRCFWIGNAVKHKYPYGMFPGIFSVLDKYQKDVAWGAVAAGATPAWLKPLGEIASIVPAMHWSQFSITLPGGLVFRGVPDTMLRMKDGSLVIVDEKTAKPKDPGDGLERLYDAQLNGYAKIANEIGIGPVSGLAIVYNVPVPIGPDVQVSSVLGETRYSMYFEPVVRNVDLDIPWVDGLIATAHSIMTSAQCPSGVPGCANCSLINAFKTVL